MNAQEADGRDGGRRADKKASGAAGFTLLETLLALTILAVALQSLYQLHGNGIRASGLIEARIAAQTLAEAVLAEGTVRNGVLPVPANGRAGGFSWQMSVRPHGAPLPVTDGPRWQLYEVSVEVKWPPARSYRLSILKLGPGDG